MEEEMGQVSPQLRLPSSCGSVHEEFNMVYHDPLTIELSWSESVSVIYFLLAAVILTTRSSLIYSQLSPACFQTERPSTDCPFYNICWSLPFYRAHRNLKLSLGFLRPFRRPPHSRVLLLVVCRYTVTPHADNTSPLTSLSN